MSCDCYREFTEIFSEMQRCTECFPNVSQVDKRTWLGHGNIEHPCDAEILFLGESPSPKRDFNETFGMRSKPAFNAFKNHLFYLIGEKPWWAMNINNCNVPALGLTANRTVCRFFWKWLTTLARCGKLKYIVTFGRFAAEAVLGKDVPLNGRPHRLIVLYPARVTVFPVRHPMYWVRRGDPAGPILDAERVAKFFTESLLRWIG